VLLVYKIAFKAKWLQGCQIAGSYWFATNIVKCCLMCYRRRSAKKVCHFSSIRWNTSRTGLKFGWGL